MQALWQDIYTASGGAKHRDQARRIANLALALHFQENDQRLDKEGFFAKLAEIGELLGGALTLTPTVMSAIWVRLRAESDYTPTRVQIDGWIEAFQVADSARKSLGAYATPGLFGDVLACETLKPLIAKRGTLRIVDPAAGAGSLLLAAYRCLVDGGRDPCESIYSLHGVELDPAARELCVLLLWTSSGHHGTELKRIAANIGLGNAITFDWQALEPFDALLMNPPWESLRQERSDPEQAQVRTETLMRIARPEPGAEGLAPLYTAQGRGDRNLFKLFVELAPHLLREGGRYGAVLPAAFGSDDGMTALRHFYLAHFALDRWTSFENRGKYFQIDSRYKFGLLTGTRAAEGTHALEVLSFCTHPNEVRAPHVRLDRHELHALGGKDRMIPELVTPIERDLLGQMLVVGTPLFEQGPLGAVKYRREVDLTLGRKERRFWHIDDAPMPELKTSPQLTLDDRTDIVPVLEGRMIGQYDCFQKSWVAGAGRRAVWEANGEQPFDACRPQFLTHARQGEGARVAICDVTSATNKRTVLAALVPRTWVCGNTAPVLVFGTQEQALVGLAILNSMVFDWFARRMVGGLHLNKFYLARLTWPRLAPRQIGRLAELGHIVAGYHPRGGVEHCELASREYPVAAMAEIEMLMALGYGLDITFLRAIFANDRSDRRGLWRYFASNSRAREVATQALTELSQVAITGTTLAA